MVTMPILMSVDNTHGDDSEDMDIDYVELVLFASRFEAAHNPRRLCFPIVASVKSCETKSN